MKIHFLQAARAIAAWLVVTDHALEISRANQGRRFRAARREPLLPPLLCVGA
jgi:peptidoglycan/LPS O-acetylase OafA/YrhL